MGPELIDAKGRAAHAANVARYVPEPGYVVLPTTESRTRSNRIFGEFFSRIAEANLNDKESGFRECLKAADPQYVKRDATPKERAFDAARDSCLVSLTAFQAAKMLLPPNDFRQMEVATKILACTQHYLVHSDRQIEEVEVDCFDGKPLMARFLPSHGVGNVAPTVVCICDDRDAFLGQILPAAVDKDISLLLVEISEFRDHSVGSCNSLKITPEMRFVCCVDYLLSRSDVDAKRIAVYGDGFAAESATNFAIYDHRVAVAVCDGGLWDAARTRGAIEWITGQEEYLSDKSARRSRLARKIKCPFLVVANEQGAGSILEAIALQAECREEGVGMDLYIPQSFQTTRGAIEDLINTNELIFDWLRLQLETVGGD